MLWSPLHNDSLTISQDNYIKLPFHVGRCKMILVTFYWRILEVVLVSPDRKAFQWNCSAQILFITCVYTDIFNFITNWFLLMRVCSPNPLMKYRQYLQITHFFHPFPQTSYCHTSSQDNFIIEPLLLLYWWQQSFPRTVSTPGWHNSGAPVEAVPTVPQAVRGFACHQSLFLSSAAPCTHLQIASCTNSPT